MRLWPRTGSRSVPMGEGCRPPTVRKMTSVPAARLDLTDRGAVRPGYAADLVLFDPATIRDRADFQHPHQDAVGVEHVFVNGRPAVLNGRLSGETPGRVLRRPSA